MKLRKEVRAETRMRKPIKSHNTQLADGWREDHIMMGSQAILRSAGTCSAVQHAVGTRRVEPRGLSVAFKVQDACWHGTCWSHGRQSLALAGADLVCK